MNNRVLVIDDDAQVIDTYKEILTPALDEVDLLADDLGLPIIDDGLSQKFEFELLSATQGQEGVELAKMALEMERPIAVALIDMRMPPGWDGLRTAQELRKLDERILIVIVTAYTDRSVEEIQQVLSHDAMLIYKPFTGEEIFQMSRTLCLSWNDRVEKQAAFEEIERLASYSKENPSPILRFSDSGELLYHNPHSAPALEMIGISEVGEFAPNAWLKRIRSVYEEGKPLEIEVAGNKVFYLVTLVPIGKRGYINVYAQDITRRYLLNRQLTYQARHDSLTGLINRRELVRKLNLLLRRVQDQGGEHAVLYLDLDRFKEVNDSAGHLAGDRLLRDLSSSLLNEVKDGDVLARIGGDEFCMLVYNVNAEQARSVGLRIHKAVKRHAFSWKGREFHLGVSIGVSMTSRESLTDADEVLNRADQACYAAKELNETHGRVYVHHKDSPIAEQQSAVLALAAEVRQAIERDRFQLHLQPIRAVNSVDETPPIHEVLLRMESETGEVISPADFIPGSERFDLMPVLDRWVIEQTFKRIVQQGEAHRAVYSINLSGLSLAGDGLELFVRDKLAEYGVSAEFLIFELTEVVAYKQLTMVQQFIREMQRLGIRVAIDDYGGVASSFTSLQKIPADMIKIDSRLVRGVIHNKVEHSIVESVHRVSSVLGMECVAVGVENPETVEALSRMGINYLQGFEIGKPELWV